jgi:cytochrome c peroxidase
MTNTAGRLERRRSRWLSAPALLAFAATASAAPPVLLPLILSRDPSGVMATYKGDGLIDTRNAFFRSLGTNGRSCATCHDLRQAMSFTPEAARLRYDATQGGDPLFARVDGANCRNVSRHDRAGHSLVLENGLIRIGVQIPEAAEFSISVVSDPYGCALESDPATGRVTASVYRRPLPSANLGFLSAVMWDGRETGSALDNGATFVMNLREDLIHQAIDATLGHAEARAAPTEAQLNEIVDFELALSSAQLADSRAGMLIAGGAMGGPFALAQQEYYPGINDSLGQNPTGAAFSPLVMQLFDTWANADADRYDELASAKADIAAGERLFNTAPLTISDVRGLNDNDAIGRPTSFVGTCTSCHDAPNVGDHSLPLPLDIGVGHSQLPGTESDPAIAAAIAKLDVPNLPVFLIQGCPNPFNPGRPASFYTTDPGRALITGRCRDLDRVKGPVLRGLAARAPYFHNGAADDLRQVVDFYDQRFQMDLTEKQKNQLAAFLTSL